MANRGARDAPRPDGADAPKRGARDAPKRGAAEMGGGTLYVVATPIGNLGDVTLRALEVLRTVPLIAAEDTRVAKRLLARYEIPTRAVSFHAQSGPARLGELLDHLRGDADLAVVTDAGTPGVSDPGEELVAAWAREGGRVVPIPGPSAVLAAIAGSGIAGPRWGFEGFLPRTGRDRRERLSRIATDDRATVLYEAPTRLASTLRDLAAACGGDREAAMCRELTKLHEQIVRGTLVDLIAAVADGTIATRGEIAIVVSAADARPRTEPGSADLEAALSMVEALVEGGTPRGDAAKTVAAATGIQRRRLYRTGP